MMIWKAEEEKINGRYVGCLVDLTGKNGLTWIAHDMFELLQEVVFEYVGKHPSTTGVVWDRKINKMAAWAGPSVLRKGFNKKEFVKDMKAACR